MGVDQGGWVVKTVVEEGDGKMRRVFMKRGSGQRQRAWRDMQIPATVCARTRWLQFGNLVEAHGGPEARA